MKGHILLSYFMLDVISDQGNVTNITLELKKKYCLIINNQVPLPHAMLTKYMTYSK